MDITDETTTAVPKRPSLSEDKGLIHASTILAIGNIASRLLGLARETVKANLFGASGLLSAFEVAALVPTSLFDLIVGGMVNSALVPVFSEYATPERRRELWGVLSTVLSVLTAVLVVIVLLVEFFTPQVAWLLGATEFDDPTLVPIAIRMMKMAAPAVLFLSIASVLTGVLYALKRFTLPAFVGATFNGTVVLVALLRPNEIDSLVWGLLIGSILQIILQLPALKDAKIRWQLDWQHPAIRRILWLYAPIVAGLIVNQLAIAFSYNLANRIGDQSVSYMRLATTLYQFPLGLVVTALSIATLPTLAQLALNHLDAYKQTLAGGIRLVMTLILPATFGLFALAEPIVSLVFEHGQFTAADTQMTTLVLRAYLIGLPFAALDQMLVFASYARKDTWRPALVGVISILVYSLTAVLLQSQLHLLSLMVADAVKHMVHTALMLWILQRQIGGWGDGGVLATIGKSLLASILTGFVAWGVAQSLITLLPATNTFNELLLVVIAGLAGVATFALMAYLLKMTEVKNITKLLLRR